MPTVLLILASPAARLARAAGGETSPLKVEQEPRVILLDAMAAELSRNQSQLKLEGHQAPYFLSYQIKETSTVNVGARYGALFLDDTVRDRRLYVDVRVGSYELDSSRDDEYEFFFSQRAQSYISRKDAPLDNDPRALRTALWLVTDEKYKSALYNFLKKKGEGVYAVDDPKKPPSFSKEPPNTFVQPALPFPYQHDRWTKLSRELSAQLQSYPQFFDSEIRVNAEKVIRYFVSSEGTRIITEDVIYGFHASVVTRTEDGQLLDNARDIYAPTEAQLPSDAELKALTQTMADELLALRAAPVLDPYNGPAILAPTAAGVLFHEAVGHRLEGERQTNDTDGKTFRGQVGKQMLPPFLSIYDDPTVRAVDGKNLNGYYLFDDEGVKGQRTVLVENGVLKSFLLSRRPVEGFSQSNGHGRSQGNRQPIARMANLIVESKKSVTDAELKKMLIAEAKRQGKPYGLIIRDIQGGNTNTSSYGYQAFKGMPRMVYKVDVKDGKETLVRGVEIVGTPLSSVNRVLATGPKVGVFNGFCGAESGSVPVSTVAPATLIQEIELQRTMEGKDRPPILPSPVVGSKKAER